MDGEADIAGIRQDRTPTMQAYSQPNIDAPGPGAGVHRPLNRECGFECHRRALESRKEVICAGVHLATPGLTHRRAHETADIDEERSVAIDETPEQLGRAFDVGQQEGDLAFWKFLLRL